MWYTRTCLTSKSKILYLNDAIYIISGFMPTAKDIWILGDAFIAEAFSAFSNMNMEAKGNRSPDPYLYQYYNVHCLHENMLSTNKNVLSQLVNATIKTLNAQPRLLRFLVCVPDLDVFKYVNHFGFGISHILGTCINWIIKNIEQAIDSKKDEYRRRRPGVLIPNEPKIVWVCIPHQPGHDQTKIVKFNTILEDILVGKHNHYIIKPGSQVSAMANFNFHHKMMNDKGKDIFWNNLDWQLECFD